MHRYSLIRNHMTGFSKVHKSKNLYGIKKVSMPEEWHGDFFIPMPQLLGLF